MVRARNARIFQPVRPVPPVPVHVNVTKIIIWKAGYAILVRRDPPARRDPPVRWTVHVQKTNIKVVIHVSVVRKMRLQTVVGKHLFPHVNAPVDIIWYIQTVIKPVARVKRVRRLGMQTSGPNHPRVQRRQRPVISQPAEEGKAFQIYWGIYFITMKTVLTARIDRKKTPFWRFFCVMFY